MNSHLSDGMPRQDCEPGAAKGKQERGASQVDALVVAVIMRGIMFLSVISSDPLREEILVKKTFLLSIEKFGGGRAAQIDFDTFLKVLKLPKLFAGGGEVHFGQCQIKWFVLDSFPIIHKQIISIKDPQQ